MAHFYFDFWNTNNPRCDILSDLCLGHDSREKQPSDSVLTKCFKYIFSLPDQRPVSFRTYSTLHFVYITFDTSHSLVYIKIPPQLMIDQPHSISGKNMTGPTDMMWEFNTSNLIQLGFIALALA